MRRRVKVFTTFVLLFTCGYLMADERKVSQSRAVEWSVAHPQEFSAIQKLRALEQHLREEEHRLVVQKNKVTILRQGFFEEQTNFIARRVTHFEDRLNKLRRDPVAYRQFLLHGLGRLFVKEREALAQMMDRESVLEPEGQELLNRILRIITTLCDERAKMLSQIPSTVENVDN